MPLTYCCLWRVAFLAFFLQSGITAVAETDLKIHGEVGRSVDLPCPYDPRKLVQFMYVQKLVDKKLQFVNGFHNDRPTQPHEMFENRSSMDDQRQHVTLKDLRMTDEGEYQCIVKYQTEASSPIKRLHLTITARYSVPIVDLAQDSRTAACHITCSSSGGHPRAEVAWSFQPNVSQAAWTEVNRTSKEDPETGLYSVSSIIMLNASQAINVSCTVGNSTSQEHKVCKSEEDRQVTSDTLLLAAYLLIGILLIGCVSMVVVKLMKSHSQRRDSAVGNSGDPKEVETLT